MKPKTPKVTITYKNGGTETVIAKEMLIDQGNVTVEFPEKVTRPDGRLTSGLCFSLNKIKEITIK
jgi:hypothetical protein